MEPAYDATDKEWKESERVGESEGEKGQDKTNKLSENSIESNNMYDLALESGVNVNSSDTEQINRAMSQELSPVPQIHSKKQEKSGFRLTLCDLRKQQDPLSSSHIAPWLDWKKWSASPCKMRGNRILFVCLATY